MELYVLDSNFFIQAHRATYPLDIAISFWNKVKDLANAGNIISIDKVKDEIFLNEDELKEWCINNLPDHFFKSTSDVMDKYALVSQWAISKNSHYSKNAIDEFLSSSEADAFLVAYAMVDIDSRIIVTQETSNPNMKSKIKIPEPCSFFNVRFINVIQMFRKLGESF